MNFILNKQTVVTEAKVIINGKELPPCPAKGNNITVINGRVYINGYEFIRGKWRKTLRALWHKFF